jgi:hypothetical protein
MPRYGPYSHYNGSIKLFFDSDSHTYLREYGPELVPQAGVTSVLRIIDKSEYLIPWAAKRTVEKAVKLMPLESDGLEDYTKSIPLAAFLDLLDQAKKAPREILEDAGDVGQEAHRALENAINFAISTNNGIVTKLVSEVKDPRAQSCCEAALDWMHQHKVTWLSTEQKVYSREHEFAGTMDGRALVSACGDRSCCSVQFLNKSSLIDWKSSNQLNITYLYQISAYRKAYLEEFGGQITDAFILRLGKEDGKFEPWHVTDLEMGHDFGTFLLCLDLTANHETTKARMSAAKKERTQRKRLAKKVAEW